MSDQKPYAVSKGPGGKPIINVPKKMPKDYDLRKDIQSSQLYKSNTERRDSKSRAILEANCNNANISDIVIGAMYLMQYFEPATEEELEYYDAWPCSLIFGKFKNKNGEPRIIGFSLHYYPPKYRWIILDRIFQIFKELYKDNWNKPQKKDFSYLQYKMLMEQLRKYKLDFGCRAYIPNLIGRCLYIPPSLWRVAAYTEGKFRKRTRQAIMNYWRNYKP